jgi:hypothetical protein
MGHRAREMVAEAQEQVQDIVAEAHRGRHGNCCHKGCCGRLKEDQAAMAMSAY